MRVATGIAACLAALLSLAPVHAAGDATAFERLSRALAGTWRIVERIEPSTHLPKGEDDVGQEVWTLQAGGVGLSELYRAGSGKDAVTDYALIWWDATVASMRGVFCADFVAQGCSPFSIAMHGNDFVFDGEYDGGSAHYRWREIFSIGADRFTQVLLLANGHDELKLASTIHGARRH